MSGCFDTKLDEALSEAGLVEEVEEPGVCPHDETAARHRSVTKGCPRWKQTQLGKHSQVHQETIEPRIPVCIACPKAIPHLLAPLKTAIAESPSHPWFSLPKS